jgi:hypothetical protein
VCRVREFFPPPSNFTRSQRLVMTFRGGSLAGFSRVCGCGCAGLCNPCACFLPTLVTAPVAQPFRSGRRCCSFFWHLSIFHWNSAVHLAGEARTTVRTTAHLALSSSASSKQLPQLAVSCEAVSATKGCHVPRTRTTVSRLSVVSYEGQ